MIAWSPLEATPIVANEPVITLLHLSDLQFGPHHRFEGPGSPGSLLSRLRDDLDRLRKEEALRPDLVLLTGDLTEYGLKSEFDQLLSFAHGLTEVTELPPRRIVIVPGNHDINWKLSEAYFAERAGNEAPAVLPYWPKLRPYADFFARFYEGQPGISFTESEPYTLFDYPELHVVVAGLNSTIAESHRKEDHHGFHGEPQLRSFAEKLRPYRESGVLRIAAVHHDPLHLGENELARQDLKDLKGMLAPYLNMVVHGHIHEEQLGWLDSDIPVLAIGSAGVKVPERPPEISNQYQIIQASADRLAYGTRAYVPDQKRWIGCLRSDPKGEAWRVTKKVAFARVERTFSGGAPAEAAPAADLAQMVDAYRRFWARAYRREALFELATMGEDADIPAGLDLVHVFLPQTALRELRSFDLPRDLGADVDEENALRKRLDPRGDEALRRRVVPSGPPQPIDQVLVSPGEPWVLVLGAPGAGKSALTRWLVLKLCAPGESLPGLSADLVPVRIELRRFDLQYRQAHEAGRSYDFFDYLDETHRENHLSLQGDPLRRLAESGRLLWLFDGLDEVADPHARRDYTAMIASLRERFGGRGVVTSRIVGARPVQPVLEQAGLSTHTLQDFDDKQIDGFLERWHRLAFPGALEGGARRLERLRRTLQENRPVRELCGNPLLLTLIALLNRGAELPKQRHRLYERTVELMAEQWEANKQLTGNGTIRFDLGAKKRFLRQLAFLMMTELTGGSGNAIRQRDLVAFAADFCAREYTLKPEEAQARAEQLIQHLRERNHVLTLLGGQTFGFVHKTFLEYLAAAEIHARFRSHEWGLDEIKGIFKAHWHDQAWEETLTLICGVLEEERPEQVVELLQAVLEGIDPFDEYFMEWFVAFAVRCLVEVRQLDQEPIQNFAQRLTDWITNWNEGYAADKLESALRLCGPGWPGSSRFSILDLPTAAHRTGARINRLYRSLCWLASCAQSERIARLEQILSCESEPEFVENYIEAAARLGEWSEQELSSLEQIVARSPEAVRLAGWISLLELGVGSAAQRIADVLSDSRLEKYHYRAAVALLGIPRWAIEASDVLLPLLQSPSRFLHGSIRDYYVDRGVQSFVRAAVLNLALRSRVRSLLQSELPYVRYVAVRWMALLWQDDDVLWQDDGVLRTWIDGVAHEPRLSAEDLSALYDQVQGIPGAKAAFDLLLNDLSVNKDPYKRLSFARWIMPREALRAMLVLKEISLTSHYGRNVRGEAAESLLGLPQGKLSGIEALVQLAEDGADASEQRTNIWTLARYVDDSAVADALLRLARSGSKEELRAEAALGLAFPGSNFRSEALSILCNVVASAASDDVRIRAAVALRDAGRPESEWRSALDRLSRSARRGSSRLRAAKELRDESRIGRLAERAKRSKVREEAANALQRLRLYRALLHVGRRRRGIVSFDGTRAGIIEEIVQGSRFTYDKSYLARPGAVAISPTLPLRPEPYDSRGLHPFFENLLPEGWLLDHTCTTLGLDRTDAFGLMLATCADCAGAVEIVPEAA